MRVRLAPSHISRQRIPSDYLSLFRLRVTGLPDFMGLQSTEVPDETTHWFF